MEEVMSKSSKRYIFLAIIFSLVTITFGVLYHFNIIARMDLYLAVTYVTYFVGIALLYNGAYVRESGHTTPTGFNFGFGILFIIASITMLVYGLVSGLIILF